MLSVKGFGRSLSRPVLRYYPRIQLEGQSKTVKILRTSINLAKIQIGNLPNTSLDRCCYTNLLGGCVCWRSCWLDDHKNAWTNGYEIWHTFVQHRVPIGSCECVVQLF